MIPTSLTLPLCSLLLLHPGALGSRTTATAGVDTCTRAAHAARKSALAEAQAELDLGLARALDHADPAERDQAVREAQEAFEEALELAEAQFEARRTVCELVGGTPYDPLVDPSSFVPVIDNPHLPYPIGRTWIYECRKADGLETTVVTVTSETREILGVTCTVVRDTVRVDGELEEETDDYFAQDSAGSVWYFGELSREYAGGYLVGIDAWLAGEDGAKPGIAMPAAPTVGRTYRMEFLLGVAEDVATTLALDEVVHLGYGSFHGCVRTLDISPLDPNEITFKSYAPGVGLVREEEQDTGEVIELVDVRR